MPLECRTTVRFTHLESVSRVVLFQHPKHMYNHPLALVSSVGIWHRSAVSNHYN